MKICNLASGSKGNCTYIQSNSTSILIDEGLSAKELFLRAKAMDIELSKIDAIVITHEHIDHIRGAQSFSKKVDAPIYIHPKSLQNCKDWTAKLGEANMDFDFDIGDIMLS
ncbi:MAG: MBL fold metallo-hydrolase, partial [Clostridia bacterium]